MYDIIAGMPSGKPRGRGENGVQKFIDGGYTGRRMASLRMRAWRVVRFMPRRTAAPLGPAMRHCVCFKARRMCWRSASSRVEIEEVGEVEEVKEVKDEEGSAPAAVARAADFNSAKGTRSSLPGESSTARSMRFSSSRTLPGQEYWVRASMASAGMYSTPLLSWRLNLCTK